MSYKLTVNIKDADIVARIKDYARKRGVTVSFLIDNYLRNILKTDKIRRRETDVLPGELDELIGSLSIDEKFKNRDYKELRDEMYEERTKKYFEGSV